MERRQRSMAAEGHDREIRIWRDSMDEEISLKPSKYNVTDGGGEMAKTLQTTCCVVGGGPAGVMLGYLLGRKGVNVIVLEKHKDFFRDFRGDTVHPSTLELMYELDRGSAKIATKSRS